MREKPDKAVTDWVQKQKPFYLGTTTITLAEIQRGMKRLPEGKKRGRLESNFDLFIAKGFEGRSFSFDEGAAQIYGEICVKRERKGLGVDAVDLMIAAIVFYVGATLVTRNISDFEGCDIKLENPWLL